MTLRFIKLLLKALTTPQALELLRYLVEVVVQTEPSAYRVGVTVEGGGQTFTGKPRKPSIVAQAQALNSLKALGYAFSVSDEEWVGASKANTVRWQPLKARLYVSNVEGTVYNVSRCETVEGLVDHCKRLRIFDPMPEFKTELQQVPWIPYPEPKQLPKHGGNT